MIEMHDLCGLSGVALSSYSYARVQWRRDYAKSFGYSLLNLLGSSLVIVSLAHSWNLASFASNAIWVAISLYGVYRCAKYAYREWQLSSV